MALRRRVLIGIIATSVLFAFGITIFIATSDIMMLPFAAVATMMLWMAIGVYSVVNRRPVG